MSIMLPNELVEVMDVLGFRWPQADEDKIFECSQVWKDYAGEVERVIADADRACREAVERNRGEAITAFEGHWQELGGQGDLRRAADAAGIVSEALTLFGDAVIVMKTATLVQLGIAAAAVVASVASAIFTAGLSTVAGAAAVQAARLAIREIIEELIEKLVKTIIPKLKHEACEIFEKILKRLRHYLDEVATKLRQMHRRDRDGHGNKDADQKGDGKDSDSKGDKDTISDPKNFDPDALKGETPDQVRARIPSDWTQSGSKTGDGEVFRDPNNPGRQIRIMPGYPEGSRPDPVTTGPYAVVSQNGVVRKVPLAGNPTLR